MMASSDLELFGKALIATISQNLGSKFTPSVEVAWKLAF